jgi:hypothetical protein
VHSVGIPPDSDGSWPKVTGRNEIGIMFCILWQAQLKTIKISAQAKLADKASNKNHKSSSVVDAPRKKEKSTKASVAVICELRHLAVF